MTSWVRLWHDLPTDPKFRTIARVAKQPLSAVVAVYIFMLTDASANASERGRTKASDENVASALDLDDDAVAAIRDAMQGRVLDGSMISGWDKRQPKREDDSADRAKAWREAKKTKEDDERTRTRPNAKKRPETDTDTEKKEKKEREDNPPSTASQSQTPKGAKAKKAMGQKLPDDWQPSESHIALAASLGRNRDWLNDQADRMRGWAKANSHRPVTSKSDWNAAFRNWLKNNHETAQPATGRGAPAPVKHNPFYQLLDEELSNEKASSHDDERYDHHDAEHRAANDRQGQPGSAADRFEPAYGLDDQTPRGRAAARRSSSEIYDICPVSGEPI